MDTTPDENVETPVSKPDVAKASVVAEIQKEEEPEEEVEVATAEVEDAKDKPVVTSTATAETGAADESAFHADAAK